MLKPPPTVRDALEQCGIRGPNLEKLANVRNLTSESILEEHRRIVADRSVRNAAAVLARVLADRHGITLSSRPRLTAGDMEVVARLEAIRRARQGA